MANPAATRATAADLLAIAEEERFHEVVDGELVRKAEPSFEHGAAQAKLSAYVDPFNRRPGGRGPGGWWFASEVEIEFDVQQVYRPDHAGWRRDRVHERPSGTPVRIRPDWVCEILSPSKPWHDLGTKFNTYQRAEVGHYWIVDPLTERLRVHRWTKEGYLVVLNADRRETVRAEPFEAVQLFVGVLFGEDD
jgi:Uma2 family endonuclease